MSLDKSIHNAADQHRAALGSLQKAQLSVSNVQSAIARRGGKATPRQQGDLKDAMLRVEQAQTAVDSASNHLFRPMAGLSQPKGVVLAPFAQSGAGTRVLPSKPVTKAHVAATAALPNGLWAQVRNFVRALF